MATTDSHLDSPSVTVITMAARVAAFDWSRTPLGRMDRWPASLRTAVGICLNSRFPMFVWWGPTLVNLYNDAYAPVLGKRHPDALGRPAHDIWHEIWPVVGPQADAVLLRGESTWNERVPLLVERNGFAEETWFTWSYSPIRGEDGGVAGLFCACVEETPRVEAERELQRLTARQQRADERARFLLESTTDAFFSLDRDWRFTYLNPQGERVLGRRADELIGRSIWDEYPGSRGTVFEETYRGVAADGVARSFTSYYPDHDRWYEVHAYPAADGLSIYFRDVSERQRAQEAQRELTERYAAQSRLFDRTLSSISDFTYTFDRAGRFTFANRPLLTLLGRTLDEVVGRDFLALGYPPDLAERLQRQIAHVIATGERVTDETSFTGPGGQPGCYQYIFSPVTGVDGAVEAVAGTTRDVTAARQAQADRDRAALALDAERANLAAIVAQAPAFIATLRGPEHVFELANDRYFELVGRRDVIGKPARAAFPEVEGQGFFELLDGVYRTGETFVGKEVPITFAGRGSAAGRTRFIDFVYQALRGPDGAVSGIFVHGVDVTDAIRAREAFAESEVRRRLALDAAELGAWNIDAATGALSTDERFRAIFTGDPAAPLDVAAAFACVHPDDRARNRGAVEASMSGGDPPPYAQEYRVIHPDGQVRWVYSKGRATFAGLGAERRMVSFDGTVADVTDRKRAEAALVESEQRYRLLVGATADVAYRMSADWSTMLPIDGRKLVASNEQPLGDWGWLRQNIPAEEHDRLREAVAQAIGGGRLFQCEHRIRGPDGTIGWTSSRAVPILGPGGDVVEWFGTATDITDRKRAEEALRASEARFRFLSELGDRTRGLVEPEQVMAAIARALGEHLRVSRCAYAEVEADTEHFTILHDYTDGTCASTAGAYHLSLFGPRAAAEQRAGQTLVIHDVDSELAPDAGAAMFNAIGVKAIVCCPLVRSGGLTAMMAVHQSTPRAWSPDEVALVQVVVERSWAYIERARTARALHRSESRFRGLADAMPQIVWAAGPDGVLDYYNGRWFEYIGLPSASADEARWDRYVHPDDLPRGVEAWTASVQSGNPYSIEFRVRDGTGVYRWFLVRALPIRDDRGEVERWFGTCTDIHAMKRMADERDALLASERDARAEAERASHMKDEFLATLSHEIRTPLSAILGWSQILKRGGQKPETLTLGLDTIERNARAQTQIVEDLLDMSRIISGKVSLDARRIDLAGVLNAAIETVRATALAKEIDIRAILPQERYPVLGDPNRLQQVFWNLLSNAIKFTPKGGRVELGVARERSQWQVSVRDSGEGIAPDFLPYVFDRFRQADASTTRRHGGLGLGLAIVKQLTELHGGSVDVHSGGAGTGATFTVALPISAVHVEEPRPADAAPGDAASVAAGNANSPKWDAELCRQLRGTTALVVDDEPDARGLLEQLLRDCEMTVLTAGSAEEALSVLARERPDVLVSDIGMPGEDGYSLIRRVRALGAANGGGIPAIALTAYARAEDRVKAVRAGFNLHVPKPVEPAELITMVASLLGR